MRAIDLSKVLKYLTVTHSWTDFFPTILQEKWNDRKTASFHLGVQDYEMSRGASYSVSEELHTSTCATIRWLSGGSQAHVWLPVIEHILNSFYGGQNI